MPAPSNTHLRRCTTRIISYYNIIDQRILLHWQDMHCHSLRVGNPRARRAQVKKLVDSAYERASGILRRNEAELHTLAQALLDKETLSGTQARRPDCCAPFCAVACMSEQAFGEAGMVCFCSYPPGSVCMQRSVPQLMDLSRWAHAPH